MILAAVILNEMHTIMSMFGSDNTSISRPNLVRLLHDVKNYCDSVNTMKFPAEWENIIQELSKKGGGLSTAVNAGAKKSHLRYPRLLEKMVLVLKHQQTKQSRSHQKPNHPLLIKLGKTVLLQKKNTLTKKKVKKKVTRHTRYKLKFEVIQEDLWGLL